MAAIVTIDGKNHFSKIWFMDSYKGPIDVLGCLYRTPAGLWVARARLRISLTERGSDILYEERNDEKFAFQAHFATEAEGIVWVKENFEDKAAELGFIFHEVNPDSADPDVVNSMMKNSPVGTNMRTYTRAAS